MAHVELSVDAPAVASLDATSPRIVIDASHIVDPGWSSAVTLEPVLSSATGTVEVEGEQSATLDAVTPSAAGAVAVEGEQSSTIDPVLSTASGSSALSGEQSATLDPVVPSSAGAVVVAGEQSATLAPVTPSAAGAVAVTGAHAGLVGEVTQVATGEEIVDASGTQDAMLDAVTPSAAGAVAVEGEQDAALGAVVPSATGEVSVSGEQSAVIGDVAQSAGAAVAVAGAQAATIEPVTPSVGGAVAIAAEQSQTLGDVTPSAAGVVPVAGAQSASIPGVTPSAAGTVASSGPTISSLGTTSGVETGGTSVVITGSGFTSASAVKFGGVDATSYTVDNDTQITATAPAINVALSSTAADNAVDVSVTVGANTDTLADAYTYTSYPKSQAGALYHNEWRLSDPHVVLNSGNVASVPCFNNNGALAQGTSGAQPPFSATGFNGGPCCSNSSSADWLLATLTTAIASGKRPYIYLVLQGSSGTAGGYWEFGNAAETTWMEMTTGAGDFTFYLQPSSFSAQTHLGTGDTTTIHVVRGGFASSGNNAFYLDGTGGTNSRTGATGAAIDKFSVFAELSGANEQSAKLAYALILNDEPSSTVDSNIRSFLAGANFPGYTSNKMKP